MSVIQVRLLRCQIHYLVGLWVPGAPLTLTLGTQASSPSLHVWVMASVPHWVTAVLTHGSIRPPPSAKGEGLTLFELLPLHNFMPMGHSSFQKETLQNALTHLTLCPLWGMLESITILWCAWCFVKPHPVGISTLHFPVLLWLLCDRWAPCPICLMSPSSAWGFRCPLLSWLCLSEGWDLGVALLMDPSTFQHSSLVLPVLLVCSLCCLVPSFSIFGLYKGLRF